MTHSMLLGIRYQLLRRVSSSQVWPCQAVRNSASCPPADLARGGTADLADAFIGDICDYCAGTDKKTPQVQAVAPIPRFYDFGGQESFSGRISTVQCFENNLAIRAALSEPANGRVLVVDAGASHRAAVLGDNLAELAVKNGWAGVLLNGFLRDAMILRTMSLGVKALGVYPIKCGRGWGEWGRRDVPVWFGDVRFNPGDFLYSDADGVLVADRDLAVEVAALKAA